VFIVIITGKREEKKKKMIGPMGNNREKERRT
jgi:hypothetical protein